MAFNIDINSNHKNKEKQINYYTYVFNLSDYLLSSDYISIAIGVQIILIKFLQMLACSFNPIFIVIWKDSKSFRVILDILDAFRLISFTQDNNILYLIFFYLSVVYMIIFVSLITYCALSITQNHFPFLWPLPILKLMMTLTSGPLFIPLLSKNTFSSITTITNTIIGIFVSLFNCPGNSNYYSKGSECLSGVFILHSVLGIIASICLIYIIFMYTLICYDISYNALSFTAKFSSLEDIVFLLEQIIFVLIREIIKQDDVAIIIYFIISLVVCVLFYYRRSYYNPNAQKCNFLLHLLLLWSIISLAIGKLLNNENFNPLLLLIFGYVIIIPATLIYTHDAYDILKSKGVGGEDYLKRVMLYLDLVENHKFDRRTEIILDTYISLIESECCLIDCPIKRYINGSKVNKFNEIYLLQYAETVFIEGIHKNPYYCTLRIYYSIFLYEKLNRKHKAKMQLLIAKSINSNPSYYDLYLIQKIHKKIQPSAIEFNFEELSNKFAFITHKNELMMQIQKASLLYIYFWSILYSSSIDDSVNITQLNTIGSSITTLISSINKHFAKLQEISPNDYTTLKYYQDFLIEILNDNHTAKKYQKAIDILTKESDSIEKDNIININLNALTKTDKIQYILIGMTQDHSSVIQGMALGICETLGYNKRELIGQSIDVIMPEMFRKKHQSLLKNTIEEFKNQSVESHIYSKQFKTFPTFCLNKMKYLIPVSLSPGIIPNELDEYYYIAKITIDDSIYSRNDMCFIMTNMNKMLYSFSSNAVPLLNLNSNDMSNNELDIYNFIHEVGRKNHVDGDFNSKKACPNIKENVELVREIVWAKMCNKDTITRKGSRQFISIIDKEKEKEKEKEKQKESVAKPKEQRFIIEGKVLSISDEKVGIIFKLIMKKANSKTNIQHSMIAPPTNSNDSNINTFSKDFIPNNQDQLFFHYNKLAYTITAQKNNEIFNQLKNDAIKQLSDNNSNSLISSSSQEYLYSSSNSTEEDDDDNSNQSETNSLKKNPKATKPLITAEQKSIQSQDEYYKANLSIIKYHIYNYQTKTFDNQPEETQTQVELKLKEILTKYESDNKADKESNNMNSNNSLMRNKAKEGKLNCDGNSSKAKSKESSLKKQLVFALSKYEKYYEITILKVISFFVMLFVIAEAIVFLLIYNELISTIKESITLVSDSYSLLLNFIVFIYLVREISLISNDRYIVSFNSIEKYRETIQADLLKYFFKCERILENVITTKVWLSDENYLAIYSTTLKVYMIREDLSGGAFNIPLFGLLSNQLDSIHDIAQSTLKSLFPHQNRVYSLIVNGLNNINEGIKHQASIFIYEMVTEIANVEIDSWILFAVCFAITIPCYILIDKFYMKVTEKKNAYLDIFFEIDRDIIIVSLHRCERYNLKLTSNRDNNQEQSYAGSCYDDYDDYDCDYDYKAQGNDNSSLNRPINSIKTDKLKSKAKSACSKEQILFMAFLLVFLGSIIIVLLVIIGLTYTVFTAASHSIEVFHQDNILQARYLTIFNIFREYMFDKSIEVLNHPLSSYIEDVFSSIYTFQQEAKVIQNRYDQYCPTQYLIVKNIINNMSICNFEQDLFPDDLITDFNCSQVTYGTGDWGMSILLSWYLEEIKMIKNLFIFNEKEREQYNFIYNLTLWGLPQYEGYVPTDPQLKIYYEKYHPINFFNHPTHDNLVILFRYKLLPVFLYKNEAMINGLMDYIDTFQLTYQVMLYIVSIVIILVYVFIWKRVENGLNEVIYKSKNLLTIIPIEVLVNLSSVQKLFKLNTKNTNDSG